MRRELREVQWIKEINDITNLVSTLVRDLTHGLCQYPKIQDEDT